MFTRFKCIAMILLFCITTPMFSEDGFSFNFRNSLFPNTINYSMGETKTYWTFNLDEMAVGDVSMPRRSPIWTPIVVTLIIVGGLLIGGSMLINYEKSFY